MTVRKYEKNRDFDKVFCFSVFCFLFPSGIQPWLQD